MFTNTSVAKNYVTVLRTKVTVARLVWHMPTHVNTSDEDRTCHMYICTCVYFACPLNEWKSSNEFSHSFDFFWFLFLFSIFFFVFFLLKLPWKLWTQLDFYNCSSLRECAHVCMRVHVFVYIAALCGNQRLITFLTAVKAVQQFDFHADSWWKTKEYIVRLL